MIESPAQLELTFAKDRATRFKVPAEPLVLNLVDPKADGDTLLMVVATGYFRDKFANSTFRQWFADATKLGENHRLLGHGVVLVGQPAGEWRIWRPAEKPTDDLLKFLDAHATVVSDRQMCLIDNLDQARKTVDDIRKRLGKKEDELNVFVVWPSDEPPSEEAPITSDLGEQRIAPPHRGFFWWLDADKDLFDKFVEPQNPSPTSLLGQIRRQFVPNSPFIRRIDRSTDKSLSAVVLGALTAAESARTSAPPKAEPTAGPTPAAPTAGPKPVEPTPGPKSVEPPATPAEPTPKPKPAEPTPKPKPAEPTPKPKPAEPKP